MKRFLILVAVLAVVAGVTAGACYYSADKVEIPTRIKININETELEPSGVDWHISVLDDFKLLGGKIIMPKSLKDGWSVSKSVAIDRDIPCIKPESTTVTTKIPYPHNIVITDSEGKEIYQGDADNINFEQKGRYNGRITMDVPDGVLARGSGVAVYDFTLDINPEMKIVFDQSNIKQGDLIRVDVENLFKEDSLEVKSDFKISEISREGNRAFFYLPITYYAPPQRYNLDIIVNGESFLNRYEVKSAQFTELHFNVEEEVTSSTVNSAAANQEYREKIHPLYHTRSEEKYWSGAFIKPVQETRITSTFGQKRFVNNSKNPERHSGIDYAAPKGTEIFAPAAGKVEFAGFLQLSGNTIVLEHGLGLKSYFFHMNDVFVAAGDMVAQGDKIGEVGTTGYSTGPHLHYQVSIENQPVNPECLYNFSE
ncbi:MAG: M23 family metallopeptidase [Oscillospiraceae bacterium]